MDTNHKAQTIQRADSSKPAGSAKSEPSSLGKVGQDRGIRTSEVDALLHVLAALDNEDEIFALLEDLFTIREIKETSQRLLVAQYLAQGKSYAAIEEATGASATTIARVSKCLSYGAGGYKTALSVLEQDADNA